MESKAIMRISNTIKMKGLIIMAAHKLVRLTAVLLAAAVMFFYIEPEGCSSDSTVLPVVASIFPDEDAGKIESFSLAAVGLTKMAGHANRSFAVARYVSVPIEVE